MKIYVGRKIF